MDTNNLIAWLPFDDSPTFDFYGSTITTYGNPTIADTNAFTGNALQLDGSSYIKITGIQLGGQDFCIDCWVNIKLFSPNSSVLLDIALSSNNNTLVAIRKNSSDATKLDFWANSYADVSKDSGQTRVSTINSVSSRVHVKLIYRYDNKSIRLYINDTMAAERTGCPQYNRQTFNISIGAWNGGGSKLIGTIDELRIYDGHFLDSGNNTPPTVDEYIQEKINLLGYAPFILKADIKCKVKNADKTWRYYNEGNTETLIISGTTVTDLPESMSVTGTAFYQAVQAACFPISATSEVWMKFDLYHTDGTGRFWAGNRNANGYTGIISWQTAEIDFWERDNKLLIFSNVMKGNALQTWLLHMKSGVTNGILELWCDGNKIGEYIGNINNGDDFENIFLSTYSSTSSDNLFSNVIISNEEIYFGEGYNAISFDVLVVDPIIVPAIGEHFNHLVYDTYAYQVGTRNIILPKRSKVYLRWDSYYGALKIFSDTDATGKIVNKSYRDFANMYAVLDECEKVFIEASPLTTPQYVIKEFMNGLTGGLDSAISTCTGGKFGTISELTSQFMTDLNASASYTDFLRDYCDIILDNADTGAITGLDAGGGVEKTAESIVPEKTSPADWEMPTAGSTTTINGLTVCWPTRGTSGTFNDAEKFILAGLNSEWIARSLELIYDTYELSFYSSSIFINEIDVNFEWSSDNVLAHVTWTYNSSEITKISLYINMRYYEQIDTDSEDGESLALGAIYLDRTLAHEFVHAIMAAYLGGSRMEELPVYIKEGTAELVHGVDDERRSAIVELLTTRTSDLETVFSTGGSSDNGNNDPYAAGYMLLRYLAKQGQHSMEDWNGGFFISNLLISDGATSCEGAFYYYEALTDNTRQIIPADVSRAVVKSIEGIFDIKFFDVVTIELLADLRRTIITKLSLYPTNNTDYFSGGGSTAVTLPSQEVIPSAAGNTSGLQSIEITLAEQQLTDQVTVTGIIPFDIMGGVSGTYLDYDYDMCVEGVTQQGALYIADCCTNLDELLYTPLNYDMPNILSATVTYSETEEPEYIAATLPALASQHVAKIADALGLTPVIQFEDFYSSVSVSLEKIGGATYADLIRDIFGWSARVPTLLINAFIRGDKLFVIQRGYEKNVIDITNSNYTLPTFNRTLMRTYYSRQKFSKTRTYEYKSRKIKPVRQSSEIYSDSRADSSYNYDNDGLLKKSVTTTTNADGDSVRTETTYSYETLESGKKVLVKETIKKYVKGVLDETTEIKHTPLRQGMSHKVMTDEDGDIISEGVGQNTSDDRVTPYSQFQLEEDYETETETTNLTIEGLTLIDTSFPIKISVDIDDSNWSGAMPQEIKDVIESIDDTKGIDRLTQITEEIKWLNRRTQETVRLSLYNYPHLIDFNDKIILNDNEYFLANNTAQTTPRIFNEQNLTLVRWF